VLAIPKGEIVMASATSPAGTWAYRSYLNTADQRPFGAGLFTFQAPTPTTLTGTLDMGSGLVLDLQGHDRAGHRRRPADGRHQGFRQAGHRHQ
jgi:hypothetical protein